MAEGRIGRPPRSELKVEVSISHKLPVELAQWLDTEAVRMGTSRRGLMNMLLTQYKDSKEMTA